MQTVLNIPAIPADSPFGLDNPDAYARWRARKLDGYPTSADELLVTVGDPCALTPGEHRALLARCRQANLAIYQVADPKAADKAALRKLGEQFGLRRLDPNMLADDDGITSLTVVAGKSERGYIPYTDRRLLWHTDGYYNPPARTIRAMVLHCVSQAEEGGENTLLDHEMVYLLMRDRDPDLVRALMAPDAMTIPANTEAGHQTRAAQSGPVFSVDPATGALHMRYTARTRSIEWKGEAVTRRAVEFLEGVLNGGSPYVFRHRLTPGQGLLCNNVLHNRAAFHNGNTPRLVYRARYYDRIQGT